MRVRTIEEETSYRYAIETARLDRRAGTPYLNHGFEIIDLGGAGNPSAIEYYQVLGDGMPELIFRESVA